ncbi:MAG TPA: SigE family RNA polymerase sigma factor [Nocardioidaceae bacterium]|nr:SigE family RNA polymerase sigma factor [Nocardioidaceae bacterium]
MEQPSFEDFVAARSRQLQRTAYLLTRDHYLAQDLVQTTYAKVWPQWSRIGDDPEAYVRRTMLNTYTSWWRRRWRGETPTEELPDGGEPGEQSRIVDWAGLMAALGRLPARQRAVVVLRYFEDLSEAETARLLNCSSGNVKSQASRALTKLRVGIGVAAALVLAAAIAVVPKVVEDAGEDPTPVEPVPGGPREWQIGEGIDSERVIASRLNDRGASELRWSLTVKRADLGMVVSGQFCHLPKNASGGSSEVRLVSSSQGREVITACRHWGEYPEVDRRMVRFSYVANGGSVDEARPNNETYTVSMWLEGGGRRVVVPGAEFGVAFYWACTPPARQHGSGNVGCDKSLEIPGGDTLPSQLHEGLAQADAAGSHKLSAR